MIRILQSALLAASFAIGIFNPVFNGLSLAALAMIALAGYIPYRIASRAEGHAWRDTAAVEGF